MDETLSELAPIFDILTPLPGDASAVDNGGGDAWDGGGSAAGAEQRGHGWEREGWGYAYGPVAALVAKAGRNADEMREDLAAAANVAAADEAARRDAGEGAQPQGQDAAPGNQQQQQQQQQQAGDTGEMGEPAWYAAWRAAAERALGEVCSGQVMLLLQDVRSLSAAARWACSLRCGRGDLGES
jgi:hypothetical protein